MSQFVAFTTQNAAMSGWSVVYIGGSADTKPEVEAVATRIIVRGQEDQAKDIFVDTELKNLTVMTVPAARRRAEFRRALHCYLDS